MTVADVATVSLRQGVTALGASAGNVVLLSPDGQWLEMVAAIGYADGILDSWRRFPLTESVALADAVRSGTPVWLGSPEAFARQYPHRISASSVTHPAHAALPLTYQGRPVGALGLSFASPQEFAESDRMFLQILAQVCANNLARAQLFETEQAAHASADEARQQRDLFIAVAGHELRQPLAALRGFAQLAERRLQHGRKRDEQLVRALEAIQNQTERTAKLIGSLLDLGRIQSSAFALDIGPADLREIVDRVVAGLQAQNSAHRITVRGPDTLAAEVDVTRIEQVVTNLLDNAIKYSPSGDILVDLAQRDAQTVEIVVRDHGPGIPATQLPHIFDP
jgi:signal transduction histidine kinase